MIKRELKIGQEFGSHTIISEPFHEGKYRKIEVQCECGKIKKITCDSVNRLKKCKKCTGNSKRKYKIGQVINCFTILGYKYDKIEDYSCYIAQCKCGSDAYEISSYELNKTKNCRSCFSPIGNKHPSYKGTENVSKTYYSQVLLGAKSRKLIFEITIEDMDNQFKNQNGLCKLSKLPIIVGNEKIEGTASLDRIDSDKGYTKDNIQWVHKDINRMKTDLNQDYFIKMCNLVSQVYRQQELGK